MQIEELQKKWQSLDRKLDRALALNAELVRIVATRPMQRRVKWLAFWPAVDVALCAVALAVVGNLLSILWRDWRAAAPAAAMMAGTIAFLASSIRQLIYVGEIDWSGPVAQIQSSLQKLRRLRIRQFKWIMLLSPLASFCAFMLLLHWVDEGLAGGRVDVFERIDGRWIVGNYFFGVAFAFLGQIAARFLARRFEDRSWWRAILDDISGKNLKTATADVDAWSRLKADAGEGKADR